MSKASTNANDSGSEKKTSRNLFFSDSELIENEIKKLELEKKVWDGGGAKVRWNKGGSWACKDGNGVKDANP